MFVVKFFFTLFSEADFLTHLKLSFHDLGVRKELVHNWGLCWGHSNINCFVNLKMALNWSRGVFPRTLFSFHWIGPLGRFSHRVTISVCLSVRAIGCSFFPGFSFALRSHDQIPGLSLVKKKSSELNQMFFFVFFFLPRIGREIQRLPYAKFF